MKKLTFLLLFVALSICATAQYHRVAKQGKVWYSQRASGGVFVETKIYKVDGDTLISGQTYPLLIERDSSMNLNEVLGYFNEDTVAGTLAIHFFNRSYSDQYYDFSLNKGDTVQYSGLRGGQNDLAVVDSVYTVLDFRNISRKVIVFNPADPNSQCSNPNFGALFHPWIEGIGAEGLLIEALPECVNGVPLFNLKCVFDGQTKIFGDTVTECYRNTISLDEAPLPKAELFPNPVTDYLHIHSTSPIQEVVIYSMEGSPILKFKNNIDFLNLNGLAIGVYIIEIRYADESMGKQRIIKQ